MEKALEIISETCWEGDVEVAKHQRLELCNTAGLDAGLLHKTSDGISNNDRRKKPPTTDEHASLTRWVDWVPIFQFTWDTDPLLLDKLVSCIDPKQVQREHGSK